MYPYLPREELVEAVNLALCLKRPLVLRGDPGCGKAELARAVAYELKLPLQIWPVKSTSLAFNAQWLDSDPRKPRPYAENFRAWLTSGKQDESRLLLGKFYRKSK